MLTFRPATVFLPSQLSEFSARINDVFLLTAAAF